MTNCYAAAWAGHPKAMIERTLMHIHREHISLISPMNARDLLQSLNENLDAERRSGPVLALREMLTGGSGRNLSFPTVQIALDALSAAVWMLLGVIIMLLCLSPSARSRFEEAPLVIALALIVPGFFGFYALINLEPRYLGVLTPIAFILLASAYRHKSTFIDMLPPFAVPSAGTGHGGDSAADPTGLSRGSNPPFVNRTNAPD